MIVNIPVRTTKKIHKYLHFLYGDKADDLLERFLYMVGRYGVGENNTNGNTRKIRENDIILITYADMVQNPGERPLKVLNRFCETHIKESINSVHFLPFFPYSSDDGFSVIDYRMVNREVGTWADIELFRCNFKLMFDLVLNHCSSKSEWFRHFLSDIAPARNYFYEYNGDPQDLAATVRPRATPLLTKVSSRYGEKSVWTTFSADQVDFDWGSPDVLFEFLDILLYYISKGAEYVRLDAIGYLWKIPGTSNIHLPQTHAVVKLFHTILDALAPSVKIITETNVPHQDNISYFGDSDEAHIVYNFSLPPLVLHALSSNNGQYLTDWAKTLSAPPAGCTFLNFSASHDGIGLTPLKGLLPNEEFQTMLEKMRKKGGMVSNKKNPDGTESPYELNITYFDALAKASSGNNYSELNIKRFLCSQAIVLAFKGIPAIYFNSLVGTTNNYDGVKQTGHARTINRYKWQEADLNRKLNDESCHHHQVFNYYKKLIEVRKVTLGFSPSAEQIIHDLGSNFFVLQRRTNGKNPQSVLCIFNVTSRKHSIRLESLTGLTQKNSQYTDLLSERKFTNDHQSIEVGAYEALWLTQH